MRVLYFLCLLLLFPMLMGAQPIIELENFANVNRPVDIANAGDERLFVVNQNGSIHIVEADGTVLSTPFLNINDRVINLGGIGDEKGLMGLVFHPNYADNGYFYVNYINNSGDTRVSRFTVTADPNVADPDSEQVLFAIDQPYGNHNGGDLAFGPDGYLYIGMGDGGAGGDPQNRSQNRQTLLGKMLRVDVDSGSPYSIPETNPFAEDDFTLDEIWALGIRNPWRFSFDRETGDLWMADVGQDTWEEIDFQAADSEGGENYGWRCREGFANYNPSGCNEEYVQPVHVYSNTGAVGCSVTGGFVYRGSMFADLYGKYIYADYCSGRIWALEEDGNGNYVNEELMNTSNFNISAFGEDVNGELYVAFISNGIIYKVTELCSNLTVEVSTTAETCSGDADGSIDLTVNNGDENYTVEWSNGATDEDLSGLEGGMYTVTVSFNNDCERVATVEVPTGSAAAPDFSNIPSATICEGEEVNISAPEAPAGYGYQWKKDGDILDGETNQDITINETGDYTLIYTSNDPDICDSQESEAIAVTVADLPVVSLMEDAGQLIATPGFETYSWYLEGELVQETGTNTFEPTVSGEYTVEIVDQNGCTATSDEVMVIVLDVDEGFGFERFSVAPNPVVNMIHIEIDAMETADIIFRIMDVDGRILHQSTESVGAGFTKDINANNWPSGVYLLSLIKDDIEISKKIVKQ